MQRLLLLLDTVSAGGLGCGGRNRVDGVGRSDNVRLVAGRGREVVGRLGELGGGGGLDWSRGVLNRGRGVLDGSGGVLDGSGGSAGLLDGSRRGVVLLNGSTRNLLGGLLADVVLVDGGLLGASNVLLGH